MIAASPSRRREEARAARFSWHQRALAPAERMCARLEPRGGLVGVLLAQGSVCDRIHPCETWSDGEGGSRRSGNRYEAKQVVIACRTKETDSTVTWATDRLRQYQTLGLQMQQTTLVGDVDVSWISSQLWPAPGVTPFFPRRHFKHQSNRGIPHLDRGLVAVLPAESARD